MTIAELLLPDFDHEMSNTRRVLERVPDDKLDYKPHPKSGTMAWLATHVAMLPRWVPITLSTDEFDFVAGNQGPRPEPAKSRDELLQRFADQRAAARAAIAAASDEAMQKTWTFRAGDHVIFSNARMHVLRNFFLHHHIHHRAQLTVYLRLLDVPVPGIYGPTADE